MSVEPFNRLVKLAARAFYDDIAMKSDNQSKAARSDNRGMAVVVLDALTRRQWVREEDLAKDLKVHSKQLRRTLRFFEEEKLITRDHRKETAKGAKIYSAAVAATTDGQLGREGEKVKLHTHSYCCLDYAQIHDVVRYRLQRMKKKLKDELDNSNTIQEYICPNCGRKYNALDALQLISPLDEFFHCEKCNSELVAESDKLAAEEMGDGDDNARRRRREKLKDMLQKMEVQLKPLMEQLSRVKDLAVPEFGGLKAWEARASAAARANGDSSANDPLKGSQGQGYGGTPMPFLGETRVEVALSGVEVKEEDSKANVGTSSLKVLPPWMIKEGMNLTKEQRGEVDKDRNIDSKSATMSDDKKSGVHEGEDEKKIQDEYAKAYYAALLKRQQEQEVAKKEEVLENKSNASNDVIDIPYDNRQVGMKSNRDAYEGEDGVEWEEASTAGNADETNKLNDLDVKAEASGDEDDIDWEEG